MAVLCDVMEDENLAYRRKEIEYQIEQMRRKFAYGNVTLEEEHRGLQMLEMRLRQLKELYESSGANNIKNVRDLHELETKLRKLRQSEEFEKVRNWRNRYGAPAPMCMHRPYDA